MRLLFLSKRRPQGRDLITRPYGRFFNIPYILAEKGHDISLVLLDYHATKYQKFCSNNLTIEATSIYPKHKQSGPLFYINHLHSLLDSKQFDWIIGCSDTWYGILSEYLARRHQTRCLIDAYDNYASYIPYAYPLHYLWRNALTRADKVTAAGPGLAQLLRSDSQRSFVVPMAADNCFQVYDRSQSRKSLNLPLDVPLVGYSGAIHNSRGIDLLFNIFHQVKKKIPNLQMVVSGRKQRGLQLPRGIISLGYIDDSKMPYLVNSLNVQLVINRASTFGNYSYPVKLYESMRCRIPVVASATESVKWILSDHPEMLATPGSVSEHVSAIISQINRGRVDYSATNSWELSAERMLEVLSN